MKLTLAKSKAGHDKNHVFLLYKEDENFVYLVNGTTKTTSHPKRKKRMHVQVIENLPDSLNIYQEKESLSDDDIKAILQIYADRLLQGGKN